jgi:pimeloyl-ACP methyl ester carboxylesterase
VREAREGITWQADVLEGQADGRPPLVLLHGPAFDRSTWQPALAELCVADPGRQVLALDLPGHGDSPPLRRYDIDSVLAAVHEAVRWTRLDSPVVVGARHGRGHRHRVRRPLPGTRNRQREPVAAGGTARSARHVGRRRDPRGRFRCGGTTVRGRLAAAVPPGCPRLVPRAGIEVFPGSGHLPHLDCPQRFAACLATMGRWPGAA